MNPNTWKEFQEKNPDQTKFFVNEIRGYKKLEERYKSNQENAENLNKHIQESLNLIHNLTSKKDQLLKEKV